MRVGYLRIRCAAKLAAFVAAAVASAGFMFGSSALATETLTLKTAVSIPGGKITSFDISFVNSALNLYILGDRTNKGVEVINTNNNALVMTAGAGIFAGATGNNNTSGPDGVMTVLHREIWAGDGPSTLRFLSIATGGQLSSVNTGGQFRVDEMCFDPIHNIGFVANNADNPAFITAVNWRTPFDHRQDRVRRHRPARRRHRRQRHRRHRAVPVQSARWNDLRVGARS